jgi:hypothetical protein
MLKPWILSGVAALAFGAVLTLPQPASASWAAAAAANQTAAESLSDVIQVQRFRGGGARWHGGGWRGAHWGGGGRWHGGWRGAHWRGGHWGGSGIWWGAAIAAPFIWGAPYAWAAAPQRCGWVWSPRRVRNVWRCW